MAKQPPRSDAQDTATAQPGRQRRARAAGGRGGNAAPVDTASAEPGTGTVTEPSTADRRSTALTSEPSEEEIRLRAYHRYLERGGAHGMDFEDWLEAERELKGKR